MQLGQREVRWVVAGVFALAVAGCATAGQEDPSAVDGAVSLPDAASQVDAPQLPDAAPGAPDARPMPDARPQPDAYVPPDAYSPPDAAGGGVCEANNECIPSECCYVLFCVPGDRVGSLCFPS